MSHKGTVAAWSPWCDCRGLHLPALKHDFSLPRQLTNACHPVAAEAHGDSSTQLRELRAVLMGRDTPVMGGPVTVAGREGDTDLWILADVDDWGICSSSVRLLGLRKRMSCSTGLVLGSAGWAVRPAVAGTGSGTDQREGLLARCFVGMTVGRAVERMGEGEGLRRESTGL